MDGKDLKISIVLYKLNKRYVKSKIEETSTVANEGAGSRYNTWTLLRKQAMVFLTLFGICIMNMLRTNYENI